MPEFELRKDVTVLPPAALLAPKAPVPGQETPWEDLFKDQARRSDGLEQEKRELVDFASQMCSLTLTLAKIIVDARLPQADEDTVTIPKALHEQMVGASVKVGTDPEGNPFVTIVERGRDRVHLAQ